MFKNARLSTTLSSLLLLGVAGAACTDEPDVDELAADDLALAAPTYRARVKSRTLTITGDAADSRLALRLASATSLAIDIGDDGTADLTFDRSTFERISIDAGGGADTVRMDESAGAFTTEEQVTVNGGDGADTLVGGVGAETLAGGAGNDDIQGRMGNDRVLLDAGDDLARWNPGDGSDVIEGGLGVDRLQLEAANIGEQIALAPSGARLRLTRDVGTVTLDADGVERIAINARGGADRLTIGDLGPTAVDQVDIDLAATPGTAIGDALADIISVAALAGTPGVEVHAEGAAVVAEGMGARVAITGGEVALDRLAIDGGGLPVTVDGSAGADTLSVEESLGHALVSSPGFNLAVDVGGMSLLTVNGQGGDDLIAGAHSTSPLPVELDGGAGNDQLFGGAAADVLRGGAGNDTIDGGLGADRISLGAGDDTFNWDPGDGSDVVDGDDGADRVLFHGSNIGERIELAANAARVRMSRDVATVALDLGGLEQVAIEARGGADQIIVGELAGTAIAGVDVELGTAGAGTGGDALTDVVTVAGGPTTIVTVTGDATAVTATGLAAAVRVTGGEAALDRMAITGARLNVDGGAGADDLAVSVSGGLTLASGAGWNLPAEASGTGGLFVRGLGGDDVLHAHGGQSVVPMQLEGGDGDDTVLGSAGTEVLDGGAGRDLVDGGPGADRALLGAGDDVLNWDPGDGSDVIEGDDGADTLRFNGSAASETTGLVAIGSRVRFTRDVASVTLDAGGLERFEGRLGGGTDWMTVGDLTGTGVTDVVVDLAPFAGGAADGAADTLIVYGSQAADAIAITVDGADALVSGLAARTRVVHPDPFDQLVVAGEGGVDTFSADPGVASLLTLSIVED